MGNMKPWERRLRDLARLAYNCGETYFQPDLFRQNTNQFLQTARTVTFLIQKNKSDIPDFDRWYGANVGIAWKNDAIMTWAKDARNVIEKEGDLEMLSYLGVKVVFSYVSSEDLVLNLPRQFLLQGDIDRIAMRVKSELPHGAADAAVLCIERRWITTSLPNHELISALTYVYARLYSLCLNLAAQLGTDIDTSIPHPTDLDPASNDVAKARYIKLGKPHMHRMTVRRIKRDPNFKPPPELVELKEKFKAMRKASSLQDVVARTAMFAELNFNQCGNHMGMLFLLDRNWKQIDYFGTAFGDQADKFLFWRNAGSRAAYLGATALVWVSETWLRDVSSKKSIPIREMPIIGERLQVVGATMDGETSIVEWAITRNEANSPQLELIPKSSNGQNDFIPFFIRPVLSAMQAGSKK